MITSSEPLWPHQKKALRFVNSRRGSLLWLPMGAGKSRIALDYIQNMPAGDTLIICGHKIISVWAEQIRKWIVDPDLFSVLPLGLGSVEDRISMLREHRASCLDSGKRSIVIVNRDVLSFENMQRSLLSYPWHFSVVDECHHFKSAAGVQSRFIPTLTKASERIIALSGTPLGSGSIGVGKKPCGGWLDIYGQARFIAPGLFGYRHADFKSRYGRWMTHPFPKLLEDTNQVEFHAKLDSFCFYVDPAELSYTLPEFLDQKILLKLPPEIRPVYDKLESDLCASFEDDSLSASNVLVKRLRLQQIAGGYLKPDGNAPIQRVHSEKFDYLTELLNDSAPDEKFVIFARFVAEMFTISSVVLNCKRPSFSLKGGVDESEAWKCSNGGVLIVQISAGSEGVDLTAARYCIYYSLCDNYRDYTQSRARVLRPGQTRPVVYYHLVMDDSVDQDIYSSQSVKDFTVNTVTKNLLSRRNYNGYQEI